MLEERVFTHLGLIPNSLLISITNWPKHHFFLNENKAVRVYVFVSWLWSLLYVVYQVVTSRLIPLPPTLLSPPFYVFIMLFFPACSDVNSVMAECVGLTRVIALCLTMQAYSSASATLFLCCFVWWN